VIIGGPIGSIDSPLIGYVRKEAERWAMPHAFDAVKIERAALGESVGALEELAWCLIVSFRWHPS
jgi:hypothetical protein